MEQIHLARLLESEFSRLQARNPSYSLRAFAKKLGVGVSSLSEVMNGRRPPTLRFGERVVASLGIADDERARVLGELFKKNTETRVAARRSNDAFTPLDGDQDEVISHWYHFAILSLAETKNFKSSPEAIAKRLGLTVAEAKAAVDRLLRLKLLRTEKSRLKTTGRGFATTSGLPNSAIRRAHLRNLDLLHDRLESTPLEDQDFSAITMAVSKSKLESAKAKIKKFRRELMAYLEDGDKDEVYNLSIYLMPLTKGESHDPR